MPTRPRVSSHAIPILPLLAIAWLIPPPAAEAQVPPAAPDPSPRSAPQIPRDAWKDCLYNEVIIRCQDRQSQDWLRIVWIDGVRSSFQRRPPATPGGPSYWSDRYGGLWRRELMIQGNTQLTNLATGNRIVVPLRFPCKPPLKGEVGYCHE